MPREREKKKTPAAINAVAQTSIKTSQDIEIQYADYNEKVLH